MSAFFSSVLAVALSEIGDKTQLLTLFLAARFTQKYAIMAGITVATLLNHAISAELGVWLTQSLSPAVIAYIVGGSFIAVGLWLLKPDKDEETDTRYLRFGAFFATLILFFSAEIGDKTQLATILLAARYHDVFSVVIGSTLGLLIANIPVIFFGAWLTQKLPLPLIRLCACAVFCVLGVITLWAA
ncbi:TMEM165/GDT1 family protein [Stenoxybacter acetivorans]|uniref:TMEM165/GDT1 family protein n=1 Tax=Stenoxybacter acetivorans TaxID=422441 RepID=UPI00056B6710|nr:TMEM165/GDT1 family protein [Stenoxybacter acetivorans]